MLKSGGTPFLIVLKSSPSVDPCLKLLTVRSGAAGVRSLPGPPSALRPWQFAQYRVNDCLPAAIDAGEACTGFWILAASGLPCAPTRAMTRAVNRGPAESVFNHMRTMCLSLFYFTGE